MLAGFAVPALWSCAAVNVWTSESASAHVAILVAQLANETVTSHEGGPCQSRLAASTEQLIRAARRGPCKQG
jgi:hypothetical protein